MSGRGRGISNAPAWMTRGGDGPGPGSGPGPVSGGVGGPPLPPGEQHDDFGRLRPPDMRGPPHPPGDRGPHHPPRDRGPPPPRGGGQGPPHGGDRYGDRHDNRGRYDDRNRGGGNGNGNYNNYNNNRGPPPDQFRGHGGRGRGPPPPPRRPREKTGVITFRSYEEERDWVAERRRKRLARKGKFDTPPTPQQLATDAAVMAMSNPAATDFAGIPSDRNFSAVPQQTRHARRLYIGHLPPNVTEQELHVFFRAAIQQALVEPHNNEDPILSVYINHERRFCFLEFKTVEMATACLALDGIDIHGKGKVKVKRPNDYNPAMAPKVHPSAIPVLDVSRLGIIGGTVQDGPNKVFIGGLHYHLAEDQVLELLQAFGKVKSFHLVKNEPDSLTSKGYCFVEYSDPNVTPVAVIGLNGMDLGGGKVLTARVAGERAGGIMTSPTVASLNGVPAPPQPAAPSPDAIIIGGYDVEALVDAAMGLRPMPTAPMHVDQFGVPITRTAPVMSTGVPPPPPPPAVVPSLPPGASALDIANAALNAAFGKAAPPSSPTRILVLLNMVTAEDLVADEDYQGLMEEVQEECAKFGKLLGMKVPRSASGNVVQSAIRKIYLEYATPQDASHAERELAGRQFGPNVVEATYYSEVDYLDGKLR